MFPELAGNNFWFFYCLKGNAVNTNPVTKFLVDLSNVVVTGDALTGGENLTLAGYLNDGRLEQSIYSRPNPTNDVP